MSARRDVWRGRWPLLTALLVVLAGRAAIFRWPVYPDEAGFFQVARDLLDHGGPGLYGHYFVDRPPTLIWLYLIGAATDEVLVMRLLVGALLMGFVALAWFTVRRLGGSAAWAVAVAAALVISPEVGAESANGEAFAIPFVMAGLACVVQAERHRGRTALWWSFGAGFLGFVAVTVKQNFADVFVFAVAVLLGLGLRRLRTWPDIARRLGAGIAGAGVGVAITIGYALSTNAGLDGLWYAAVEFRPEANDVLAAGDRTGIEGRIDALTQHAWMAGLIPFGLVLLIMAAMWRFRVSALSYAIGALIAFETACVVLGGNFWPHYLMGLAPGLVLAAGMWGRHLPVRVASTYVVVACLVSVPVDLHILAEDGPDRSRVVGEFVKQSSEPGDTATVLFGKADLLLATGMRSPYEHMWSLPVRVLDPDLDQLTALLRSGRAPTWLVEAFPVHNWGLDPAGQVDPVIAERYREVWSGCGDRVYLLRSADRDLAAPPDC
jgi:hypothetical protein